ncbi:hypothetical protein [Mangrovimonas sp. YM274]|uniref:hypothetical protein n=1 Tax=Mangrovimonas sp. YM274 TaxID=3070660 RepID=UPI0027DCB141|nr:hypothetical protein [Mangrovimonas sp. YM274]WMI69310.1 hypothetical protein RBH95_02780 [Mangrovimonas sp. YM274]
MKHISTYISLLLLIGCSASKQENKLIGNWYSGKDNRIEEALQFYKDSLVLYTQFGKKTLKWSTKRDKIYVYYLKEEGITYNYTLDERKQTLKLKLIGGEASVLPTLTKAKNPYAFFLKMIDMEIELPTTESKLNYLNENNTAFNIYAGYNNNTLTLKTDTSANLNNLKYEVDAFVTNSREELKPFLKFNLVADKNIAKSDIDSIKQLLNKTAIKPIYRTYKNEQINYKGSINWFGKME